MRTIHNQRCVAYNNIMDTKDYPLDIWTQYTGGVISVGRSLLNDRPAWLMFKTYGTVKPVRLNYSTALWRLALHMRGVVRHYITQKTTTIPGTGYSTIIRLMRAGIGVFNSKATPIDLDAV